MKKRHLIMSLIIIIAAGVLTPTIAAAVLSPDSADTLPQGATANRRQIEEQILAATVRFRIDAWVVQEGESGYEIDFSFGHATVKDGRYLVTHNHFGVPLSIRSRDGEPGAYGTVTLFDSAGRPLFKGPLSDFELVWEDPETLVIGAKDPGLFKKLGLQSAAFQDWSSVPLEPGQEVAQVDWDGVTTRVDWTTIQEVTEEDGVPQIVLADDALPGASGGGVFWRGVHVANNWQLVEQLDASGTLVGATTKAALNGPAFQGRAAVESLPAMR